MTEPSLRRRMHLAPADAARPRRTGLSVEGDGPELSVVVPMLNERATIQTLFAELRAELDSIGRTWEVVFVDDGSTDGTFGELVELASGEDAVTIVKLRRNFGKATALAFGFEHARGRYVVTMDSDLQDDPAEISRLLAALETGFDVASGWKADRKDPRRRTLFSRIFNLLVSRATGLALKDVNCGLKAYRSEVLDGLSLYGELHRFIPVLAHFDGFRVTEVPVNHRPRQVGRSRYGAARYLRGFLDLLTVTFFGKYLHRPLHLFGGLGLAFGGAGFVICLYLTLLKVSGAAIGHRPLLILGALLIMVGVQLGMMGLLAELFTRLNDDRSRTASARQVERLVAAPRRS